MPFLFGVLKWLCFFMLSLISDSRRFFPYKFCRGFLTSKYDKITKGKGKKKKHLYVKKIFKKNRKVRLFLFGDYNFLLKTLSLSSAASKHPSCYHDCKAANDDYQTKPAKRPEPVKRS